MATGWVYHELYMWHDTGRTTTAFPNRSVGGQELQPHQGEIIRRAERHASLR